MNDRETVGGAAHGADEGPGRERTGRPRAGDEQPGRGQGSAARKYSSAPPSAEERLRAEQQAEAGESWVGPGVPAMTDAQAKGLVFGSIAGGIVGALLFLPLAFIPVGMPFALRLLIAVIAGALAGGTGLALYLGGRQPELEGETLDANGRPSVGTTMRDPHTDERGR